MGAHIITNSLVESISVNNVNIWKKVGEHGYAELYAVIADEKEDLLIRQGLIAKYASFYTKSGSKEEKIFAGVISKVEVYHERTQKTAYIRLEGATKELETKIRTRTFQNEGMTYDALLAKVNEAYPGIEMKQNIGNGKSLGKLIVQYKEDDWTFMKRLASIHNQQLITKYDEKCISYHFGLNNSAEPKEINEISYAIGNLTKEYLHKSENEVPDIAPIDFEYAEVISKDFIELGDMVKFHNSIWSVYEVNGSFEKAEMIYTYKLRRKNGFKVETLFNWNLTGASLNCKILNIQNDTVKVCVDVDGVQDEGTAKWFPFSTVYSSPDGTGWYCMPEKGDSARLYFPNEKEEDGYIISAIHVSGGGNTEAAAGSGGSSKAAGGNAEAQAPRTNPDNKVISNKFNKEIRLTPTQIVMTNNDGTSVTIDDTKGILIESTKKITIKSDEEVSILSTQAAVNVKAKEAVEMVQGESKIIMHENITFEGARFFMQ